MLRTFSCEVSLALLAFISDSLVSLCDMFPSVKVGKELGVESRACWPPLMAKERGGFGDKELLSDASVRRQSAFKRNGFIMAKFQPVTVYR